MLCCVVSGTLSSVIECFGTSLPHCVKDHLVTAEPVKLEREIPEASS